MPDLPPDQKGTIFEPYGVSGQADGGEVSSDISGAPLEPLNPESDPNHEITQVDEGSSGEPPTDEPTDQRPQSPQKPRSARERIAQLIGQRNEERDNNAALQEQMAAMQQQLTAQQQILMQSMNRPAAQNPGSPPSGPANPDQFQGLFNSDGEGQPQSPQPQPGQAPAVDIASTVRQTVQEQLAPLLNQQRESAEQARIRAEQEQSFQRAAQDYPELADPNSNMRQLFNELYDADAEARTNPRAPERLALQVRGLLADERAASQRQASQKRGAAVHTPQPTMAEDSQVEATSKDRQQYAQLMQRIRAGDNDPRLYIAARKLSMKLGRTTPQA